MIRLFDVPIPPPRTLADLRCRLAVQGEARLIKAFIREHHSLLPNPPAGWRAAFVLEDRSGNVWGVATWGRPVARMEDQQTTLELTRMALASGLPKNAATWFLARMRRWIRANMPEIKRLISYQDAIHHHGTIYKADNWRLAYEGRRETSRWGKRRGRTGSERILKHKWEREP